MSTALKQLDDDQTTFDWSAWIHAPEREPIRQPRPVPYQASSPTSRAGAVHIKPEADSIRAIVAEELFKAGSVSEDGSTGGLTIQELAAIVTRRRGIPTKETTICGRLGELQACEKYPNRTVYAIDSGKKRLGNAGVKIVVWVHAMRIKNG